MQCTNVMCVWLAWHAAYSAKSFYDDWYIATYNFLFTSLPVLAMGMFGQQHNTINITLHSQPCNPLVDVK